MFRPTQIVGQTKGKGNGDRQVVVPFPANVARFTTLQDFVAFLEARGLKPQPLNNDQWRALCPAHDDQHPSLTFTERDGRILVNCFAGCTVDAICGALGITLRDLRTDHDLERRITFEVRDPNGTLVALHERIERDGKKTFVWRHPDGRKAQGDLKVADLPLYGVHKLQSADFVVIVEGEKCAEALWSVGIPAVATYGATCDPADEPLKQVIERAQTVYLWADNDDAGRKHMERLGKRLLALGATDVRWVEWNDAPEKGDAADAVAQRIDIRALLDAAKPFEPPEEAPQNGATPPTSSQPTQCPFCQLSDEELLALARPVLDAENPVADAAKRLCDAAGIVAEDENAQLLLLIATTRILPNPVHALVVGTTGAGKSALVNAISAAIPPCHRRTLVGTSARALLVHPLKPATLLNWLELPNLDSESIASTILRALLWQDGSDSADYLLTEWVGGRAKARTLKLPRQIALLSTRVDLPKDEQLTTRLFVVEVKETPEKRQSVLSAIARQWQDSERPDPDALRQPVVAFMEWAQRRTWRVVIPFADALMALLSQLPPAERDYRDAANLLRLIAASAIWHLQHRQHAITDESVTVIADLADYALVRQLVAPTFAKTRAFALSEGERQIVDALRLSDAPMTVKELAERLSLSDAAVRMRLQALKKKGVVSDESVDSRRKAWRLEGTPTMTNLLPTVEALKARWQPEPPDPAPEADAKMRRDAKESPPSHFSQGNTGDFDDAKMRRWENRGQNPPPLKVDDFDQPDPTDPPNPECFTRETLPASANIIETAFAPSDARKRKENKAENAKVTLPSHSFASSDSDLEVKVTCPRCGAWRRVLSAAFMLAAPRCLVCGEVMRPEPEGDPPTEPADPPPADPALLTVTDLETGEPLVVGTDAWLEATFGTACPDCGTTLTDGTCPTCGYPDDRPQWRIGRLVMAIAKALRSRHPQCRSAPCDACRQVVVRMNRAVVANDWQGLIALWREVTTDGDAEVSS
jgi:DNA-binding Lrp family transcriptional regulator/energy-coupling factor transporter ATP-binding protein EcfA2